MFKRTRIETREGLFGQVVSERKFIFDGHFYPFGFRVEEFVRLPNRVNHIVAGTKAFGRAFVHNRKFANGREYLEVHPGEWVDVTWCGGPTNEDEWASAYLKELSELPVTESAK